MFQTMDYYDDELAAAVLNFILHTLPLVVTTVAVRAMSQGAEISIFKASHREYV